MSNVKNLEISKEIDSQIGNVLNNKIKGFEKAFVVSSAISTLRENLSSEFMAPIMKLQGSRLGFLTDKDKHNGYDEKTVKDCLIDAVLLGLQPTGNHFNIISGNMYPTREGFGYLLTQINGLRYNIEYTEINKVENSKTSYVTVKVTWVLSDSDPKKQAIKFPIKSDSYTSQDALIGKAERKARRWLFNQINGTDISDGDTEDIPHVEIKERKEIDPDKERIMILINDAKTQDDLDFAKEHAGEEFLPMIKEKQKEINLKNK